MLGLLRKTVYKAGLRPKQGNIFYSPILHYNTMFGEITSKLDERMVKGAAEAGRLLLYGMMRYCTFCGKELEPLLGDEVKVKECPAGCGSGTADIDTDGSPFIAFDR